MEADVARHARLIDALPRISYTTASGLVADRPAEIGDRVSLAGCLTNSTKPVLAMPVTLQALAQSRQMAGLAAGGALPDKPLLIVYAEPVSPLVHPDESIKKLLYCAEHRLPVTHSPAPMMGGTAPVTLAGGLALAYVLDPSGPGVLPDPRAALAALRLYRHQPPAPSRCHPRAGHL